MNIQGRQTFDTDLDRPLRPADLGEVIGGDRDERLYRLRVTASGRPVDCTEAGVTAYLTRSDRQTLVWPGEGCEDGVTFSLPEEAHAVPGAFRLTVRLTMAGVRHTVFAAEGVVRENEADALLDPARAVPSLDELLASLAAMQRATEAAQAAASALALRLDAEGNVVIRM